jgi:hypothetical protein
MIDSMRIAVGTLLVTMGCAGEGTGMGAEASSTGAEPLTTSSGSTSVAGLDSTAAASSSSSASSTSSSSSSASTGSNTTGTVFDLGAMPDFPAGTCAPDDPGCGCTAVDVLFVLDVSGSICPRVDELVAALPGFVDEIYAALPPGLSIHLGLTTSAFDASGEDHYDDAFTCANVDGFDWLEQHYLTPDEGMLPGDGIQGRLYPHEGLPYFAAQSGDDADRQALSAWLAGLGAGIDCSQSHFEYPASGAAYAVHPINLAGANAGFLREDGSVLLVFLMDNADHSFEVDDADALHDMIVASKGECGEQCVVAAGLLAPTCDPFAYASIEFVEGFERHLWGSVNVDSDYTDVLGAALAEVVATTCAAVAPAG